MEPRTLLAVDDDPKVLDILDKYFSGRGFQITTCNNPENALDLVASKDPDLILLDVNMPGKDGFTLCREIRQTSQVPIIMLTAEEQETDRVLGLELGADDYVLKPFSSRELEARIKAALRRIGGTEAPKGQYSKSDNFYFGNWVLDTGRRELRAKDGDAITVTGGEYRLLLAFVEHPNRVLSRDQIMNLTKGHDSNPFDRSVDVQVGRLRKKLGDDGPDYQIIKTFRGEGYVLVTPVEVRQD